MTIREYEKWHGAVLQQIVEYPQFTAVNKTEGDRRSTYVVNLNIGLFVKHCAQRPYQFHFTRADHGEIQRLAQRCGEKAWVALVCCEDNEVCLISNAQYKEVSNGRPGDFSVSVSLPSGRSFRVSCSRRRLDRTVPRSAFPGRLFGK